MIFAATVIWLACSAAPGVSPQAIEIAVRLGAAERRLCAVKFAVFQVVGPISVGGPAIRLRFSLE
jgi:hypothetical protein